MLRCLPQTIGDIQSLKILNVSYNLLVYLPATILHLRLQILDISMNTHLMKITYQHNYVTPNLAEISFATLQRHRFVVFIDMLRNVCCVMHMYYTLHILLSRSLFLSLTHSGTHSFTHSLTLSHSHLMHAYVS